jgi:hypothetical protein
LIVTRHSRLGALLAHAARLVGGPLPLPDQAGGAAVVSVTEDSEAGGQIWSRSYARRGRFPQTINSTKQFLGETGLREFLGFGLAMQLAVREQEGGLVFSSAGYRLCFRGRELRLPAIFDRMHCEIRHVPLTESSFRFTLSLRVPRIGELIYQEAEFEE